MNDNIRKNEFLSMKAGDLVVASDEYLSYWNIHVIRIDSVEKNKEFITETNPEGIVAYGTDLNFYDPVRNEMVGDEYVAQVHEGNFHRKARLEDRLWVLPAGYAETYETEHFVYHFYKDEDFDITEDETYSNMVMLSVRDKEGNLAGDFGNCHLLDFSFDENELDKTLVEGKGFAREAIEQECFVPMPYEEFLKTGKLEYINREETIER